VGQWLFLNAKRAIVSLYYGKNKLHSMRWWSPLCTNTLRCWLTARTVRGWTCCSTGNPLSWFRNNECLLFRSYSFMLRAYRIWWIWPGRGSNPVFSTRDEHANHYIVHAILLTILIIVVHVHAFEPELNGQIKLLRIKGIF
jgi:hypothetical protein